jgi:hypothetical protein
MPTPPIDHPLQFTQHTKSTSQEIEKLKNINEAIKSPKWHLSLLIGSWQMLKNQTYSCTRMPHSSHLDVASVRKAEFILRYSQPNWNNFVCLTRQ